MLTYANENWILKWSGKIRTESDEMRFLCPIP
jgi:hypothetical protein